MKKKTCICTGCNHECSVTIDDYYTMNNFEDASQNCILFTSRYCKATGKKPNWLVFETGKKITEFKKDKGILL